VEMTGLTPDLFPPRSELGFLFRLNLRPLWFRARVGAYGLLPLVVGNSKEPFCVRSIFEVSGQTTSNSVHG
jgi:hypothetical protein